MSFDPEQITFFAKTDSRGANVPFGIKAKDRTRHVYVIGKTGMGKSTLLENMAVQDIKNGNGLAFIDPHGQTAETLLNYIPEERKADVLYFAPFDMDCPVSFNVMEDVGPERRHLVVSGLMSVFKKIWVDAWSARMEYILSNTLLALLEYPESTLLGVNRMLSDKNYRAMVIDNIKDPSVKSFWVDEFLKYNERYMQEAGDAIKNKIGQFTSNPLIRNIVGQPHSSFDIREIMDKKKILIMNLSKGLVGESNANLLGSMLTTRIYLAAMSRADLTPDEMDKAPNFYFYVDEFQSFANATFANILSEARKYKLNLTIAHQYITQMEEEVRDAVFGNVGTLISFRVGPFDAEVLETVFTPKFLAPDIVNLGFAQIYLSLMIDGIGSAPFSATTLPPIPRASVSCRDMILAESRRQFSRPRAIVETEIVKFHEPVVLPPGVKATDPPPSSPFKKKAPSSGGAPSVTAGGSNADRPRRIPDAATEQVHRPPTVTTPTATPQVELPKYQPREREEGSPEERPRPQREHRPAVAPVTHVRTDARPPSKFAEPTRPEKSLADLRAVLQSITKKDTSDSVTTEEVKPKKETVPDPGLKDALARALGNLDDDTKETKLPTPPIASAAPVTTKPVAQQSTPVSNEPDNPLDPKRLERMMRVNGSDRPPL